MSRWRQALDCIGGPDAVTWPAFWITLVASVTGNLTTGGDVTSSFVTRMSMLLMAQVAMFVPLVLLRFTLLRDPPRPRPAVALIGFALAVLVRALTLGSLLLATGGGEPLWAYRIVSSFLVHGTLLVIIAVVVGTIRAQTRSLQELARVQSELELTQMQIIADVSGRNDEVLGRVKVRLADELAALEVTEGAGSVAELQRLASDVVRPLSHELAVPFPAAHDAVDSRDEAHVTWRQVVWQMSRSTALRPVIGAVAMAFAMVVATLGTLGGQGAALTVIVVVGVLLLSWLANLLLARLLPRVGPRAGIVAVVASSVIVGFLSAGSASLVLGDGAYMWTFGIAGGVFVSGLVLLLAVVGSVLRQQAQAQQDLAENAERLRRAVVRLRQVKWFQGKALARALHGPVQSAVTSAALRLDAALRAGSSADELLPVVRSELRSVIDVLDVDDSEAVALNDALDRVVGIWAGLCDVSITVDDAARRYLDADPVLASTVIDLLTDATSNAIRHGDASRVRVSMTADAASHLELLVQDDGTGSVGDSRAGLGTRLLEDCTLQWSRTVEPDGHLLTALLPVR